jgi:DNA-directed RNA polymerase specialized sigma24 family protein
MMPITDESLRQFLADEREKHIRTMRKRYRLDAAMAEEIYHEAVLALLDRSIVRMKAKGLPFRLIASELHMNQGTVRRRHSEAVAHLRKFRVPA